MLKPDRTNMKHHRRHKMILDRLPKLNHLSRRAVAVILPWFSFGLGIVQLILAVVLWNLLGSTQTADGLGAAVDEYYNGAPLGLTDFDKTVIYICIGALAASAALFILAVGGLRARRNYAWRMVLAAILLDFVYGVGQLVIDGRTIGDVLSSLVKTGALLYLLGQVHEHFVAHRKHKPVHHGTHAPHHPHHPQHGHAQPAHRHEAKYPHNPHIKVG